MPLAQKNKTPWILVISSMILLFLFVGYWNASTYLREKNKLADDVEIQLQLAYTEIKDSELIYFIQTRLSEDQEGNELLDSISFFFDTHPFSPPSRIEFQSKIIQDLNPNTSEKDTAIFLGIEIDTNIVSSSTHEHSDGELTVIATSNLNSIIRRDKNGKNGDTCGTISDFRHIDTKGDAKILKNRFQLMSDSSHAWVDSNRSLTTRYDSLYNLEHDTLLSPLRFFELGPDGRQTSISKTYALFQSKLDENNLPNTFEVVTKPDQEIEGMKITYTANGFALRDWTIDLQNYQFHILKKMIPTLLFSLFLLGIIGLAFWTLLRNWIRQNRLVIVKNEFINNMTHELKTPIATVGVALEAISKFDLSKEQNKAREYLEMSRSEVNRLSLLVDKVLNIAAFDSNHAPMNSEDVDLEKIIEENINAVHLQLENTGGSINFSNHTSKSVIKGDALHLSNVIHNMVDNAIKYCKEKPEINIALKEEDSSYLITVSDNGLGIPKEYQDKIFDRFFRVPTDDKHDVKGHGLGLNYSQNVVVAHGGKIDVQSVENEGTTFTISLPKKRRDA